MYDAKITVLAANDEGVLLRIQNFGETFEDKYLAIGDEIFYMLPTLPYPDESEVVALSGGNL